MSTQTNSLLFRNIVQFLPNGLLNICQKIAAYDPKQGLTTIQASTNGLSISIFSCQATQICQEGRELEYFSWFVSRDSYDTTQYTPRQFPIDRDIIQLADFIHFIFEFIILYPRQLSDDH